MTLGSKSIALRLLAVGIAAGVAGLVVLNLVVRALSGWTGLLGDVVLVMVGMLGALIGLTAGVGAVVGRAIALKLNSTIIAEVAGAAIGAFIGVFVIGVAISGLQPDAIGSTLGYAAIGAVLMAATVALDARRRPKSHPEVPTDAG